MGGRIGLEIAEACRVRDLEVTVVDRSATPIGTFDPDVGEFIAEAVRLAEERGRDPDAAAGRGPFDADAVADNERWAEGQRRSAEEWDRLAAKAEAELAAVSQKCGGDHG